MVFWGLTPSAFSEVPYTTLSELYMLNAHRPFLPSSNWVQSGTIASCVMNTQRSKKDQKVIGYEDIYPFLKNTKELDLDDLDEENQTAIGNKLNSIFGG